MANQIPQVLQNYELYREGGILLGVVDAELPTLQAMTAEVKGAGILGTFESVVKGHFSSTVLKLTFRMIPENLTDFLGQDAVQLELWAAVQSIGILDGKQVTRPDKVIMRGINKNTVLGKDAVGAQQDPNFEYEILYLRIYIDGKEQLLLDKLNYKFDVGGVSQIDDQKKAIGLM